MSLPPASPLRISTGLAHLTQLHSERSHSISSDSSDASSDAASESSAPCQRLERSWSWGYLKNEFSARDAEVLFRRYQVRLQHNFFLILMLINIIYNGVAIIIYFHDQRKESFPGAAVMRSASLVVYILFLILSCLEEVWLRPTFSRVVAAVTVMFAMIFGEYGAVLYVFLAEDSKVVFLQRIRPTFYLIIATHVFLPFPSRIYGWVSTTIIVSIEMAVSFKSRLIGDCPSDVIYKYAIADLTFYFVSAMIGFVMTYMLEIANRRAFFDHRKCVHSKFKMQFEKEQQDQLLNSCLPRHLAERVKADIRRVSANLTHDQKAPSRPFNELYVEKYSNVSILYADIVNSMTLAAKLSPHDLVETLNDLFGRFDASAERNNCLRIKLLGDCYYCVSGVPEFDPFHAKNCVEMALEMISIIRSVREERDVDVDMRIGIHSGMVLSGLMGLHKWQYDIWSLDAMTASDMEHTGVPGKVHVTQKTLDLLPPEYLADLYVRGRKSGQATTYLITRRTLSVPDLAEDFSTNSPQSRRKKHGETLRKSIFCLRRRSSLDSFSVITTRRSPLIELKKFQELNSMVNQVMEVDIESMPLSKRAQWLNPRGINPFFLTFTAKFAADESDHDSKSNKTWNHEKTFAVQSDPLFRYYLYCSGVIEMAIILIKLIVPQMIRTTRLKWALAISMVTVLLSIGCTYIKSENLNFPLRICIWLLVSGSLLLCSSIDIMVDDCSGITVETGHHHYASSWVCISYQMSKPCQNLTRLLQYYTFCFILSMSSVSLFIRIGLWFKAATHLFSTILYTWLTNKSCSVLQLSAAESPWFFMGFGPHATHVFYVASVAFLLHMMDRQIEFILRLDYQWRTKLETEKGEAALVKRINRILLKNVLPYHVAQRFLNCSTSSFKDNLYSESYESVAVMFASIPNYSEFYNESKINEDGLKCLLLLNEIICDFDKVLALKPFTRIEKIKTIGSTYMAACGLDPGRGSIDSNISIEEASLSVTSLVRFALTLMKTISRINRDALQDFQLRIGIAVGPVIGGVVGAGKPQYDIWGDTVNVASRMESTGLMGRIQVTETAADLLFRNNESPISIECRGPIEVKGKGQLITYLVNPNYQIQQSTPL